MLTVNPQWDATIRAMSDTQLQDTLKLFTGQLYRDPEGNGHESIEAQFIRDEIAKREQHPNS